MKQEIINECARLFDVHPRDLVGPAKFAFFTKPRFALYKALRMRAWSTSMIGRAIGGRDHSTILYGIKRAEYIMERDPHFADVVQQLAEMKPTSIDPSLLPSKPEPDPEEWEKWYA